MHKKEYRSKEKAWKDKNYLTFCFHLPKELVLEFREKTKKNGDTQRQIVINMMERYLSGSNEC